MQGKREKKSTWTGRRLLGLALVLAGLLLLPTLSHVFESAPPAEEVLPEQPTVEELTVVEPSVKEPAVDTPSVEEVVLPETPAEEEPRPDPDPERPMIALTFDDGPGTYTDAVLDIFAQHGGKGTFFMVGRQISSWPDTVRRMAEEGHDLGNHSWNHSDLAKLSAANIASEINKTRDKIREVAGVENVLMRLPYGSTNEKVRTVAGETQSILVRWSVDPQDWRYRNADTVYNAVMNRVKDGSIVLVHDIHPTTIEALQRLIPDLQAAGYQLVTVSQLLEHRYEETAPQIVYPPAPPAVEPAPEPAPAPQPVPEPAPAPQPVPEPVPEVTLPAETLPQQTPEALPADPA